MATGVVGFDVIENSGPNNLRDLLKVKLAEASEVYIAVAFLTESGLAEIIQPLRQVAARGQVRLLTGLYQRVTEPKALRLLLRIQRETRERFSIRLSREPRFHRKVYLLENRTRAVAIVGSSNLTREGLRSGGELNLLTSLPKDASSYKRLRKAFDKDWHKRRAVPLTRERIKRYEHERPSSAVGQKTYSKDELRRILGTEPTHEGATPLQRRVNTWRDCITGFVKERTDRIIGEVTNWDTKDYSWFSAGGSHPYQTDDLIFLFDSTAKRIHLVEVKDFTRTPIPTPDGRHFIAYRRVRGYARRFSRQLWSELETLHIRKNDLRGAKTVGPELAKQLRRILRVKKSVG
jgi:HKD family nuclease